MCNAIDSPAPPYFHGCINDAEANDRLWQAGNKEGAWGFDWDNVL